MGVAVRLCAAGCQLRDSGSGRLLLLLLLPVLGLQKTHTNNSGVGRRERMVPHYNMVFFLFVRARSFSHFTLSNPLVGGSVGGFLMRLVGSVLGINNKTSHPHTKRKHSERESEREQLSSNAIQPLPCAY